MVYGQAWNYFLTILTVTTVYSILTISHHHAIRSQYFLLEAAINAEQ
jgi:hypothetical protein